MADRVSSEQRSANMRAIRSTGMKPEMAVRRLVHAMGYRYRLHRRDLPGNPDLVFAGRRKVIFVHGCFWHQHPDSECKAAHTPRSNTDYWGPKLARNVTRDRAVTKQLEELGWAVCTIWECQIKAVSDLRQQLQAFLEEQC